MLRLHKISITGYKNHEKASFDFGKVTGICGLNGVGKTNLLDAIYYCCFTRSYFSLTESLNIGFGQPGFRIEGLFSIAEERQEVVCIHRGQGKKEVYLNGVPYEKLSKHIGFLPIVVVAPDDAELIAGASEKRRRFMDTLLCQMYPDYLEYLIHYNKVLQQRNSLLRQGEAFRNHELLDVLDKQMTGPGTALFERRKIFLHAFSQLTSELYRHISGTDENPEIKYESQLLESSLEECLKASRGRDIHLQRSTAGIHKDDIAISFNGHIFKHIASQGQRKSMLFALKMAEYELLKQHKGFSPLLLLDDAFEKLDYSRMHKLLSRVCSDSSGQVFITDTHRNRLEDMIHDVGAKAAIIEL